MKKYIDDKLTIYGSDGLSPNKLLIIQDAVNGGLEAARQNLDIWPEAKVRVWILAKPKHNIPSQGTADKKFINIGITKKYLNSRNSFKKIGGTVIHEYIHFVRLLSRLDNRNYAKTVLGAAIEEGVSIYIQSIIAGYPDYLDVKNLNESMIRTCWDKFSEVIDKPAKKYYKLLENDEIYRAIYYRLGFGIIRKYMKANPDIDLAKLVKIPESELIQFAKKIYYKKNG